jgi:hypothetical protein
LGRSVYTIEKNTEGLAAASEEIDLEVNAENKLSKWSCLEIKMLDEVTI